MTTSVSEDEQVTKTIGLIAATAFLLLTAACSSTPGTASPAPSSAPPAASTGSAAPKVTNPIDTSKFEHDACSALTKEQASQLVDAVRTNRQDSASSKPACDWISEYGNSISVTFLPGQGGLTSVYENARIGNVGYFEPSPAVAGYPAAFVDVTDTRKKGGCQIMVGITDAEVFAVSSILQPDSPSYGTPCQLVTKAAESVLTTIKGGA